MCRIVLLRTCGKVVLYQLSKAQNKPETGETSKECTTSLFSVLSLCLSSFTPAVMTIASTTYVKYNPGVDKHSVVSVRFNEELDELFKK